jgi:hypothetical protein
VALLCEKTSRTGSPVIPSLAADDTTDGMQI